MNILAIQLKRIGDLILTTPALARVRELCPDVRIELVVESGTVSLLPALEGIDEFHVMHRGESNKQELKHIRQSRRKFCLDFTGTDRSALVTFAARASKRATFQWIDRKGLRRFLYNKKISSSVRQRHTLDHYMDLVTETLGLPPDDRAPEDIPHGILRIPEETVRTTGEVLEEHGLRPGGYFIVHAGAARPEKMWMRDRWPLLVEDAVERTGLTPVFTGGHSEPESIHTEAIFENLPEDLKTVNLVAQTDLLTTAEIVRQSAFVLGVDTSIIHFAGAFRRPHLVLYGRTNPFHWRVRQPEATVLMAGRDEPVAEFLPDHNRLNMSWIKTEHALKALRKVLNDAQHMGTLGEGYAVR